MVLICNSLMLRIISYHCWSFVCLSLLNVSSELLPDFNCVLVGVFCLFVVVDVVVVWFWEVWVLFCCYCLFECLIWLGYYPLIRSCLASIFPHYLRHLFTLHLFTLFLLLVKVSSVLLNLICRFGACFLCLGHLTKGFAHSNAYQFLSQRQHCIYIETLPR